jgi:3'(2'), 5'-bisphosphate nucleotidase
MNTDFFSQSLLPLLKMSYKAGEAILEVYNKNFEVHYKDDKSPLTFADMKSHEIIVHHLRENELWHLNDMPSAAVPVVSEEGQDNTYEKRKNWNMFWLVDPLDGTKEFIKRNGEFTVNIALIKGNRPVFGVIYIPVKDLFYFGAEGSGSYKLMGSNYLEVLKKDKNFETLIEHSEKLPLHSTRAKDTLMVIGSRSHGTEKLDEFVNSLKGKYKDVDLISAGSSLKFCLIAEGRADIYPRFGPTMEWDTAAGHAIVNSSGGQVVDMEKNEPLQYNKKDLHNPWFVVKGMTMLYET